MNKRTLKKILKLNFPVLNNHKGDFLLRVKAKEKEVTIKFIKVTSHHQLTFNSASVIDVSAGIIDGLRFKKKSTILVDLARFKNAPNPIIVLSKKPYRILQYLNESDIIDVSDKRQIHQYIIVDSIEDLMIELQRL